MEIPFRPNGSGKSSSGPLPDEVLLVLFGIALALFIVFFSAM